MSKTALILNHATEKSLVILDEIGQRLKKTRLRGFDYSAKPDKTQLPSRPTKKDWRKRTRQAQQQKGKKY